MPIPISRTNPSPLPNAIPPELEPDKAWKDDLRAKIEQSMSSKVEDAKKNYRGQFNNGQITTERRETLDREYSQAMQDLRALAQNTYTLELERERQERRWAAGVGMDSKWGGAFIEEQKVIWRGVKSVQKEVQSPTAAEPPPEQPTRANGHITPPPGDSPIQEDSEAAAAELTKERRERSLRGFEQLQRELEQLQRESSFSVPSSPDVHETSESQKQQEEQARRIQERKERERQEKLDQDKARKRKEKEEDAKREKEREQARAADRERLEKELVKKVRQEQMERDRLENPTASEPPPEQPTRANGHTTPPPRYSPIQEDSEAAAFSEEPKEPPPARLQRVVEERQDKLRQQQELPVQKHRESGQGRADRLVKEQLERDRQARREKALHWKWQPQNSLPPPADPIASRKNEQTTTPAVPRSINNGVTPSSPSLPPYKGLKARSPSNAPLPREYQIWKPPIDYDIIPISRHQAVGIDRQWKSTTSIKLAGLVSREDEVKRREEENRQKEEGIRRMEEAVKQKEEEIGQEEEAAKRKQESNGQKEVENRQKEEGIRQAEQDIRRQDVSLWKKAEILKQRDEQLSLREGEVVRKEEELAKKAHEVELQENNLKLRNEAVKAREAELELLIAAARESSVVFKLQSIFGDVTTRQYKRLLRCVGTEAQTILDNFQSLLDSNKFPDRGQLIVAMRRLSAKTGLYPQRYMLNAPMELFDDQPVGTGSFADIYRARFQGQTICLKVIKAYDPRLVKHMAKIYAREAILWGQLSHPNLLPFYGLHTYRAQIAFVAPYAEQGNLRQYLINKPIANRILLCADTAAGVQYLHALNLVHGDLKTVNVLVDASGRGRLADFGISGVEDKEIARWTSQSSAASKGGTTRWQAPELHDPEVEDTVHNTKESDVFAWASTGYEIFTDDVPYSNILNETKVALMIQQGILPGRPPEDHPSWGKHGLTNGIWELLRDCWRRTPTQSPTISDVMSRLEIEKPSDTRPPAQWDGEFSRQFRNAPETGPLSSMVDLDATLSKILDDRAFEDVDDELTVCESFV